MVPPAADDESGAMDNPSPAPSGTPSGTATAPNDPTPPPSGGPRVTRDQVRDLGRLRRSVTDRRIAGVAGGIARHLDVDPIIVRVALVVGAFFGGAGLLAYVGVWLLVPEEGTDDEPLGLDVRSRSLALAGVGVVALLCAVGDWAGAFQLPLPVAVVAVLTIWFLRRKEKAARRERGYAYQLAPPAYGYEPADSHEPAPTYAPVDGDYARAPRPRHPRRRGPILFFFTLALILLAEGVLGVIDLAGAAVTDSAYPALALGIVAAMLVLGSFWGRAGGLIALGVVLALATAGATIGTSIGDDGRYYSPTSATEVQDTYEFGGGRFTLDLSDVSDVEALDGHAIDITGVGGRIDVIVPDGMDVDVTTAVVGGDSRVFGQRSEGFDINQTGSLDGGVDAPDLSITIDLFAGEILVRDAA